MVLTWILLLQISTYNGYKIEGYRSQVECAEAAKAFLVGVRGWQNATAICIPGPSHTGG